MPTITITRTDRTTIYQAGPAKLIIHDDGIIGDSITCTMQEHPGADVTTETTTHPGDLLIAWINSHLDQASDPRQDLADQIVHALQAPATDMVQLGDNLRAAVDHLSKVARLVGVEVGR